MQEADSPQVLPPPAASAPSTTPSPATPVPAVVVIAGVTPMGESENQSGGDPQPATAVEQTEWIVKKEGEGEAVKKKKRDSADGKVGDGESAPKKKKENNEKQYGGSMGGGETGETVPKKKKEKKDWEKPEGVVEGETAFKKKKVEPDEQKTEGVVEGEMATKMMKAKPEGEKQEGVEKGEPTEAAPKKKEEQQHGAETGEMAPASIEATATTATEAAPGATPEAAASAAKPQKKEIPRKTKEAAQVVYDDSVLTVELMPEILKRKVESLFADVQNALDKKQGDERSIQDMFYGWNIKACRRTAGQSNHLDLYYYDGGSGKCRSKNDIFRHFGLNEHDDVVASALPSLMEATVASLIKEDFTLVEPLRVSRRTVVMNIGKVETSSIVEKNVYPIGYTARVVLPSPVSVLKDAVYECRVEVGPKFVVSYLGAAKPEDVAVGESTKNGHRSSSKKKGSENGSVGSDSGNEDASERGVERGGEEDEEDNENSGNEGGCGGEGDRANRKKWIGPQQRLRVSIHPDAADTTTRFQVEGSSPSLAVMNLIRELERLTEYNFKIAENGTLNDAPATPAAKLAAAAAAAPPARLVVPARLVILREEPVSRDVGEILFGFSDYRIAYLLQIIPRPGEDAAKSAKMRLARINVNTIKDRSIKKAADLDKRLERSVVALAKRIFIIECRSEVHSRKRMKKELELSKKYNEAKKESKVKIAAVRKEDATPDLSKRVLALSSIKRVEESALENLTPGTRQFEELQKCLTQARTFWEFNRWDATAARNEEAAVSLSTASATANYPLNFPTVDPVLLSAWDFISMFGVTLGLCSAESRAIHIPGEFPAEKNLILKTRASSFTPSIELEEFIHAFESGDERLMFPIHSSLLRAAVLAVYNSREEANHKIDRLKRAGEHYVEPEDELDPFGKTISIEQDSVAGVPVTELSWFELARVCFGRDRSVAPFSFQGPLQDEKLREIEIRLMGIVNRVQIPTGPVFEPLPTSILVGGKSVMRMPRTRRSRVEVESADEDDEISGQESDDVFLSTAVPAWVSLIRETLAIQSNRGAQIRVKIEDAIAAMPKNERKFREKLTASLELFRGSAAGMMRDRAVEVAEEYMRLHSDGQNDDEESEDDEFEDDASAAKARRGVYKSVRPITPFDSAVIKSALQGIIKKLHADNEWMKSKLQAIESRLASGEFESVPHVLSGIDDVWQSTMIRFQKGDLFKAAMQGKEDLKSYLDASFKETGTYIGGITDFSIVKRKALARPHQYFSLLDATDLGSPSTLAWDLATPDSVTLFKALGAATDTEMNASSSNWKDELYVAKNYSGLSRSCRLELLQALMDVATDCDDLKKDVQAREAEAEKVRIKYGQNQWLVHWANALAGGSPVYKPLPQEILIDQFMEKHQTSVEPKGFALGMLERVKKDIHEEYIYRDQLARTLPFRVELDRMLSTYATKPTFLGYDRSGQGYFHFAADPKALFVFGESLASVFRVADLKAIEDMIAKWETSGDSRCEIPLAEALKERLPILQGKEKIADLLHRVDISPSTAAVTESRPATASPTFTTQAPPRRGFEDFGPYVGHRVGRNIEGHWCGGSVIAYMSGGDKSDEESLWKIVHDDGDDEVVDKETLIQALAMAKSPIASQSLAYMPSFTNCVAPPRVSWKRSKRFAYGCTMALPHSNLFGDKMILDLKIILLCCEEALKVRWNARGEWIELVRTCASWQGIRTALALFEWRCLALPTVKQTFFESFPQGSAANVASLPQLACRILLMDRLMKYPAKERGLTEIRENGEFVAAPAVTAPVTSTKRSILKKTTPQLATIDVDDNGSKSGGDRLSRAAKKRKIVVESPIEDEEEEEEASAEEEANSSEEERQQAIKSGKRRASVRAGKLMKQKVTRRKHVSEDDSDGDDSDGSDGSSENEAPVRVSAADSRAIRAAKRG